jgi:hypothetical protein
MSGLLINATVTIRFSERGVKKNQLIELIEYTRALILAQY